MIDFKGELPEGHPYPFRERKEYWQQYIYDLKFLKNGFDKGDSVGAGTLIAAFERGAKNTLDEYGRRLKGSLSLDHKNPFIIVITDTHGKLTMAEMPTPADTKMAAFVIDSKVLEEDSWKLEDGNIVSVEPGTGIKFFEGSIVEFYELAGAEEAHHAVYRRMKADHRGTYGSTGVLEHVTKPPEYRALAWRVKYARAHNMSRQAIESGEKLYVLAKGKMALSKEVKP